MSTAETKLQAAKDTLASIEASLRTLIDLHENSRIILFSDKISSQLGESYATHAFERCRLAIFESELVRLCALWDEPKGISPLPAEYSLPAVARLVADPAVLALIEGEYAPHEKRLGVKLWRGEKSIEKHVNRIDRILHSELLNNVRNYRSKYLAHNLRETNVERRRAKPMDIPRYRNVAEVLGATISLAHDLTIDVTGVNFAWDTQREHSKRYAAAMWHGCKITPIE